MNSIEKLNLRKRIYELVLIAVAFVAVSMALSVFFDGRSGGSDNRIELVNDGWYMLDGNIKSTVDIPVFLSSDKDIVIYNDSFTKDDAGKLLTTRGAEYDIEMYCGERLLYKYEESIVPRNAQLKSKMDCDATIPAGVEDSTIKLVYHQGQNESVAIEGIFIGTAEAVMGAHYKDSMPSMAGMVLILMVALFAICLGAYTSIKRIPDYRAFFMGVFLLILAIWFISDSYMIQRLFNLPNGYVLGFYALAAIPIPFVHCIMLCEGMGKYKKLQIVIALSYANIIAQGMLDYLEVLEVTDMLYVTHAILVVGIVGSCTALFSEYRSTGNAELREILIGFAIMAFLGIMAMMLYWLMDFARYGELFEAGTLIFVIDVLIITVRKIFENFRFRLEVEAYEKLSKEDMLTGLGSRKAYDEYMSLFQTKMDNYDDAMIAFIDILDIMKINAQFGNNAGDEIIATAGRCVDNTFGYAGYCFRLTGTELCVIIPNPTKTEGEWFANLEEQVEIANRMSSNKVNLIWGSSMIKGDCKIKKTISKWKLEADKKLSAARIERGI